MGGSGGAREGRGWCIRGKDLYALSTPLCFCSSGDSTARLWRLREDRSHDPPVVLPHEPVGSGTQKCNRDVTTVHWNVRVWREGGVHFEF